SIHDGYSKSSSSWLLRVGPGLEAAAGIAALQRAAPSIRRWLLAARGRACSHARQRVWRRNARSGPTVGRIDVGIVGHLRIRQREALGAAVLVADERIEAVGPLLEPAIAAQIAKASALEEVLAPPLLDDLGLDRRLVAAGKRWDTGGLMQLVDDAHSDLTAGELGDDQLRIGVARHPDG